VAQTHGETQIASLYLFELSVSVVQKIN